MSRALCIPFHRYHPHSTQHYRVWMQALLSGLELWGKEFDRLYLIDDYWDFDFEELDRLNKLGINYKIITRQQDGHHWVQFHTAFPAIKEDFCLFLDNDVVIWRPGIVDGWFKQAESGRFVTALDGSGGLGPQVQSKFSVLKDHDAHRMGSYYFILSKEQKQLAYNTNLAPIHYNQGTYIKELDYTTVDGDWQDSFGAYTLKLFPTISDFHIIDDDRSSVYLEDDGTITKNPGTPKRLGYYHVRNGGHTTYLLSTKYSGALGDYNHSLEITPRRELLRIMVWHYLSDLKQWEDIKNILTDIRVSVDDFMEYVSIFKEYHGL